MHSSVQIVNYFIRDSNLGPPLYSYGPYTLMVVLMVNALPFEVDMVDNFMNIT